MVQAPTLVTMETGAGGTPGWKGLHSEGTHLGLLTETLLQGPAWMGRPEEGSEEGVLATDSAKEGAGLLLGLIFILFF